MVMVIAGARKFFKLRNNIFSCWLLGETAWVCSFPREATSGEVFIFINLSVCLCKVRIAWCIMWWREFSEIIHGKHLVLSLIHGAFPGKVSSHHHPHHGYHRHSWLVLRCHSVTVAWEDLSTRAPNERTGASPSLTWIIKGNVVSLPWR